MALTNTQISQFFLATKGVAATGGTLSALKDLSKTAEISVLENSTSAYAAKDNADFVAGLYKDILNRDASEDEIKAWSDAVAKFGGRAETLKAFTASVSANDKNAFESSNIDYVKGLYATYANDANPSQADLQAWAKFLNEGTTNRVDIVDLFVNTVKAEINTPHASGLRAYVNELIGDLYNNVLGRAATAGELTAWSNLWFDGKVDSLSGLIDLFNETASKASGDDKATYDNKMSFCESYASACPNANQADATHCDASGITAETTDAADQGKTNGEADEQQAPIPGGKEVPVTFDAINGDIADARETDDALVVFDETDPAVERIVAEKILKVATSEVTTNVSFDESLSALKNIETVAIASDEKSVVTVNADGLANLKALTAIEDEAGATTLNINTNLKNLKAIDLKAGADTLNINDGATLKQLEVINLGDKDNSADTLNIAAGAKLNTLSVITTGGGDDVVTIAGKPVSDVNSLTINLGDGDDTLTIGKDLEKASIELGAGSDTLVLEGNKEAYSFASLSGLEGGTIVGSTDEEGTTIALNYQLVSETTGNAYTALEFDIKNDITLQVSGGATSVDFAKVSGVKDSTNNLIIDASSASGSLVTVAGSDDRNLTDILSLGSGTYSALASISDIELVTTKRDEKDGSAEVVTLTKASEIFKDDTNTEPASFELDGALDFTVSGAATSSDAVSINLTGLTGNDNDDVISIKVAATATTSKSGSDITIALDENDGIAEVISLSGYTTGKAFDKVTITGLDTSDVISLKDIARDSWKTDATSGAATFRILKDIKSTDDSEILKAFNISSTGKEGAILVADTDDGLAVYMVNKVTTTGGSTNPSLNLLAFIDGADIGARNPDEASFTIA